MTIPVDWAELDALVKLEARRVKYGFPAGGTIDTERWRRYRDAYEKRHAHVSNSRHEKPSPTSDS